MYVFMYGVLCLCITLCTGVMYVTRMLGSVRCACVHATLCMYVRYVCVVCVVVYVCVLRYVRLCMYVCYV